MQAVLDAFDMPRPPDMRTMMVNTERWIMSPDGIIAGRRCRVVRPINALLAQAIAGADIAAGAAYYVTQGHTHE